MSEPAVPPAPLSTPPELFSASELAMPAVALVRPPRTLLADSVVSLVVVAVCAWQRGRFLDISDSWLLALSLVLPLGNLLGFGLSLAAYKLRVSALYYRMALGTMFTLYYGYVALHVAGLHESPLGALLLGAVGDTAVVKLATGLALLLLLVQTFVATDACQRTLTALHPPLVEQPVAAPARSKSADAVTLIPT